MKLRITLFLLFLPIIAIADAFECSEKLPKEADFLNKVQAAYSNTKAVEAEFEQESYLSALDLSENSKGSAWFLIPGKMRWDYKDPEEQVFLFKDATVWLYQKTDRQVLIQDVPQVLVSDLPVSFMLGLGDIAKDFSIKALCKNQNGIVAELSPNAAKKGKTADEALESLSLMFNQGEYFPKGAKIVQNGGNSTRILFSSMKFNDRFNEALFNADFPKNVDVIDKRDG